MRRFGGRIRFELLAGLCLIALLAGVLLERLLYYQELAERTVVETTITHIRSGMRWHVADLMTRQRSNEIGAMLDENPVRWLKQPPAGYLGAFSGAPAGKVPGGSWYFDSQRRELVYVPRLRRFLTPGPDGYALRFAVQAKNTDRKYKNDIFGNVEGIDIAAKRGYRWF